MSDTQTEADELEGLIERLWVEPDVDAIAEDGDLVAWQKPEHAPSDRRANLVEYVRASAHPRALRGRAERVSYRTHPCPVCRKPIRGHRRHMEKHMETHAKQESGLAGLSEMARMIAEMPDGYVRAVYIGTAEARALLALLTRPAEPEACGVCCGHPLASGRQCICGGLGTAVAEMQGLREELLQWEIAAGHIPALPRESSSKFSHFAPVLPDRREWDRRLRLFEDCVAAVPEGGDVRADEDVQSAEAALDAFVFGERPAPSEEGV